MDAELRAPDSLLFHRYQYDGYGEHADGAAFDGSGIGRLWPLLAGERGSYAHEAGADAVPYLEAMLQCTTAGGMLPEQVWDADPVPLLRLSPGRPSGSAAPLVWAHAEFVKLYLLVFAGCRADRLDRVADRYRQPVVPKVAHIRDETDLVVPSSLVSVEAAEPFTLRWGSDGWQHIVEKQSSAVPFGLHAVQLSGADLAGRTTIEWTRRFGDRWENVDHVIRLRIDTVAR